MKKIIFQHKPSSYQYGQYNFTEDSLPPYEIENSTSVPIRYDKFSDKDLYSSFVDNEFNTAIIDGNLQYEAESYFSIDKCDIRNAGVNSKIRDIDTRVFICDSNHPKFGNKTPDLMDFDELDNALFDGDNSLNKNSMVYQSLNGGAGRGGSPGNILENQVIFTKLHNYNNANALDVDFNDFDNATPDDFDASIAFTGEDESQNGLEDTGIFNFDTTQQIYVIVFTSGDMSRKWYQGGNRTRKHRIHVFAIDTAQEFTANGGEIRDFSFSYSDAVNVKTGPRGKAAAFVVDSLKFSINSMKNYSDEDYSPAVEYLEFTGSIQPPSRGYIGADFNEDFLSFGPNTQIISEDKYDYIPIPNVKLKSENFNLQNYYIDDGDTLITSAPNQVNLDFNISTQALIGDFELNQDTTATLNHLFYVVSWDDPNGELDNWQSVLEDLPSSEVNLIKKQDENVYILAKLTNDNIPSFDGVNNVQTTLINNYNTPGLKTIRSVMFSYYYNESLQYIEPVRWKLITTRIFLDIPINQYPDFNELGGSDYVTIPWPYTTPIIGGVDENSKYKKSVQDTLMGGKIGNTDIIDERFLVNDLDNDEVGKSILSFDLEQIRYFNKSYNINKLLNIPTNYYDYTGENIFNETDASTFHGYNGNDGASPDVETPDENGYYIASRLGSNEELITNGDFTADNDQSIVTTNTLTGWTVNHSNDTLDYISLNNNQLIFNNVESNFNLYIASPSNTVEDGKTYLVKVDIDSYTDDQPLFELGGGTNIVALEVGMNEFEWTPDFSLDDAPIVSGKVVVRRGGSIFPKSFTLNSISVSELGQGINTEFLMSEMPSVQGNTIYEQSFKLKTDAEVSLLTITFYDPDGASNDNPNGTHNEITATLEYLGDEDNDGNYVYRVSANETLWSSQTRLRAIDFFIREGGAPDITFVGVKDISLRELGTAQRYENLHNDFNYWDGKTSETTFPMESSVGQIFITDNQDNNLKQNCKLEINTGEILGSSIYDSSGNSNKGILIGDYKVKKTRKVEPMRRDSFIKLPKKTSNRNGAL